LEQYGDTEPVSVVFPFTALVAKDFAKRVEGMLGRLGRVQALSRANKLLVQDTAGNLKRVRAFIKDSEDSEIRSRGRVGQGQKIPERDSVVEKLDRLLNRLDTIEKRLDNLERSAKSRGTTPDLPK